MKNKFQNLGINLSREQAKSIKGGEDALDSPGGEYDNGWKCCWINTNNCSVCAAYGSCVSGAKIRECV
jgi:hypothetical protein